MIPCVDLPRRPFIPAGAPLGNHEQGDTRVDLAQDNESFKATVRTTITDASGIETLPSLLQGVGYLIVLLAAQGSRRLWQMPAVAALCVVLMAITYLVAATEGGYLAHLRAHAMLALAVRSTIRVGSAPNG